MKEKDLVLKVIVWEDLKNTPLSVNMLNCIQVYRIIVSLNLYQECWEANRVNLNQIISIENQEEVIPFQNTHKERERESEREKRSF